MEYSQLAQNTKTSSDPFAETDGPVTLHNPASDEGSSPIQHESTDDSSGSTDDYTSDNNSPDDQPSYSGTLDVEDESGVTNSISHGYEGIVNLFILVAVFVAAKFVFTRFLMAAKKGRDPENENLAYSLSVFSMLVSLAIILTSVIYGDISTSWGASIIKLLTYSVLGIVLLILSGLIFDRIANRKVYITREIANGNTAAAIVDAGNFIASALIISATLKLHEFKHFHDIVVVLSIYFSSQLILTAATLIRKYLYNKSKDEADFETQIAGHNTAAAIDFAGRRIATALALSASIGLLSYGEGYNLVNMIINWALISVVLLVFLNLVSWCASKIIFWDKNLYEDILNNKNSAALSDAAVYISFGIILAGTMIQF